MASSAQPAAARTGSVGFTLAVIALIVAAAGVGLAYVIDATGRAADPRHPGNDPGLTVTRAIGGHELTIPLRWFRYDEQPTDGFASQVDLRLDLPLGPDRSLQPIDVMLVPRSRARPSAALLDGVYLHQFEAEQLSGPPGLIGKPLKAGTGYAGEIVWYDALSSEPFVAKCAPIAAGGAVQCLRTVYLAAGIAAVYAFPDTVLHEWRRFDAEVGQLLRRIGAMAP